MKLGSLFDGIGGWPWAAVKHGAEPVWSSEIEPFPIKVTKIRFPGMKHLGDIAKINGAEIEPVDIITSGSPCQDLSVAGKRAGLEGKRSGLFMEGCRIIKEMRDATNGTYPRYAVWENVPGAFSSANGEDFRAVLEEYCQIADPAVSLPRPPDNSWTMAGTIMGDGYSVAWRTLDAQYWGVAQRRKRIFLVADFGSRCAGEILFKPEGLRGYFAEGEGEREGTAGNVKGGAGKPSGFSYKASAGAGTVGFAEDLGPSLLSARQDAAVVYSVQATGFEGDIARTLTARNDGSHCADRGPNVVAIYDVTHVDEVIRPVECGKTNTLNGRMGTGGNQVQVVMLPDVSAAVTAKWAKGTGGPSGDECQNLVTAGYKVRRLTPTECERLQGLPDGWTDIPGATDTARYKALGSGMAQPCPDYVIERIMEAVKNDRRHAV